MVDTLVSASSVTPPDANVMHDDVLVMVALVLVFTLSLLYFPSLSPPPHCLEHVSAIATNALILGHASSLTL